MSVKQFCLPDLGEGLTEGEIVSWQIKPGDTVELNQVVGEVETAKATVELPSPLAGQVVELHANAGETVAVGLPLVSIRVVDPDQVPEDPSPAAPADRNDESHAVLVGYGPSVQAKDRRRRRRPEPTATRPLGEISRAEPEPRPLATPPVRKLARDLGIDLSTVPSTRADGAITRNDVLATSGDKKTTASAGLTEHANGREERIPVKGVRQHTAAAVTRTALTVPQAAIQLTVDVTPMMELLEELRANSSFDGIRLTPLTLIARALIIALRRNPMLNAHWDEQGRDIVIKHYVNLGIATATPRGLLVPNIKDAERCSLRELALQLNEVTDRAKAGKASQTDLADGTVTITNIGVFGVDGGTPILNPDEAAIVALGAIRRRPWEHCNEVALRSVVTLGLAFDHRLIDGEHASHFLVDIGAILGDPISFIATS